VQADLTAGSLTNTATASGNSVTSNQATATVTALPSSGAALSLVKSASPTTYSAVGQVITYTFTITNSGATTLPGPFAVTDNRLGSVSPCGSGPLASGASTTCTATHTIVQADLTAGSLTNTATASGNSVTSNQATATVTALPSSGAALSLVKSASPTTYSAVGQVITYTFTITNSGATTLPGPFAVTDNRLGSVSPCGSGPLASGASTTCTATHTIVAGRPHRRLAHEHRDGLRQQRDFEPGDRHRHGLPSSGAALSLVKSASPTTYSAVGQVITYTLRSPTAARPRCPARCRHRQQARLRLTLRERPLASGASTTCTATHTIVQADLTAGSLTNTATASGNSVTSNQATATVTALPSSGAALSLVKSASRRPTAPWAR